MGGRYRIDTTTGQRGRQRLGIDRIHPKNLIVNQCGRADFHQVEIRRAGQVYRHGHLTDRHLVHQLGGRAIVAIGAGCPFGGARWLRLEQEVFAQGIGFKGKRGHPGAGVVLGDISHHAQGIPVVQLHDAQGVDRLRSNLRRHIAGRLRGHVAGRGQAEHILGGVDFDGALAQLGVAHLAHPQNHVLDSAARYRDAEHGAGLQLIAAPVHPQLEPLHPGAAGPQLTLRHPVGQLGRGDAGVAERLAAHGAGALDTCEVLHAHLAIFIRDGIPIGDDHFVHRLGGRAGAVLIDGHQTAVVIKQWQGLWVVIVPDQGDLPAAGKVVQVHTAAHVLHHLLGEVLHRAAAVPAQAEAKALGHQLVRRRLKRGADHLARVAQAPVRIRQRLVDDVDRVHGVDVATGQLDLCRERVPGVVAVPPGGGATHPQAPRLRVGVEGRHQAIKEQGQPATECRHQAVQHGRQPSAHRLGRLAHHHFQWAFHTAFGTVATEQLAGVDLHRLVARHVARPGSAIGHFDFHQRIHGPTAHTHVNAHQIVVTNGLLAATAHVWPPSFRRAPPGAAPGHRRWRAVGWPGYPRAQRCAS